MQATIKEKREVAKGTLFVTFDLGGEDVEFEPGQYFWVELLDPPYDDEKGPRRHITVVTSPTEKGVLGLATRIRDTAFKRSLVEMPEGAAVDVEQPKGSFTLPEDTIQAVRVHRGRHRHHAVSLACSATSPTRASTTTSPWSTRTATSNRPRSWTS